MLHPSCPAGSDLDVREGRIACPGYDISRCDELLAYGPTRVVRRFRRDRQKGHAEGYSRVARWEIANAQAAARRFRWRLTHDLSPDATPVYVVGVARSGTTMLVDALSQCPEAEIYRETDAGPFKDLKLRDDHVIRTLVERSKHRFVVFKPICDSHRVVDLLDGLGTASVGRAIWCYRPMEGRVRSALRRWPAANATTVLRGIADSHRQEHWEAGGLSPESLDVIRSFDYDSMTRQSAAALVWYVRNTAYFDLRLGRREEVMLASYERFLREREAMMRRLCSFLSLSFNERMTRAIEVRRPATSDPLDIDPRIRELCVDLERRFAAEEGRQNHDAERTENR